MAFFYAFWPLVQKNQKKMDYRKFFHIICYGSMHQIIYVILVQSVIVQSCSASCRECNVLKWHSYISIYRIFWVMKCFPFLLMFHDFSTPTITCVVGSEKNYKKFQKIAVEFCFYHDFYFCRRTRLYKKYNIFKFFLQK